MFCLVDLEEGCLVGFGCCFGGWLAVFCRVKLLVVEVVLCLRFRAGL